MATIRRRGNRYHVQVRRKGFTAITKTFRQLADAKEWARHIERQVDRQELGPDRKALEVIKLADLVIRYRDTVLPGKKGGNFPTTGDAFKLVWRRLVKRAGIEDLHFHDLRHEAISRLFELGLTVPEVAAISGHRDMRMLFRYAHANHSTIRAKLQSGVVDDGTT